jgi:hypothetical protein
MFKIVMIQNKTTQLTAASLCACDQCENREQHVIRTIGAIVAFSILAEAEKKHINHHFEDAEESDCDGVRQNCDCLKFVSNEWKQNGGRWKERVVERGAILNKEIDKNMKK